MTDPDVSKAGRKYLGGRTASPLRVARMRSGKTQRQLAAGATKSLSTIGELERGERLPTVETAREIADALGVAAVDLWPVLGRITDDGLAVVVKRWLDEDGQA